MCAQCLPASKRLHKSNLQVIAPNRSLSRHFTRANRRLQSLGVHCTAMWTQQHHNMYTLNGGYRWQHDYFQLACKDLATPTPTTQAQAQEQQLQPARRQSLKTTAAHWRQRSLLPCTPHHLRRVPPSRQFAHPRLTLRWQRARRLHRSMLAAPWQRGTDQSAVERTPPRAPHTHTQATGGHTTLAQPAGCV